MTNLKPTSQRCSTFPIMRQVHLIAAVMIFSAFLAWHFLHPNFIYLALMVGVGLTISGVSGYCPMAFLLQRLPCNKKKNFYAEVNCQEIKKNCCS